MNKNFLNLPRISGNRCLDFINTVERSRESELDWLETFEDVAHWFEVSAYQPAELISSFLNKAHKNPSLAKKTFLEIIELRESMKAVFTSIAVKQDLYSKNQVKILNDHISRVYKAVGISLGSNAEINLFFSNHNNELIEIINPVVISAFELVTDSNLIRLKKCHRAECPWLFLDTSKNNSRKWCEMEVCGNRIKNKRFHRKDKNINQ